MAFITVPVYPTAIDTADQLLRGRYQIATLGITCTILPRNRMVQKRIAEITLIYDILNNLHRPRWMGKMVQLYKLR